MLICGLDFFGEFSDHEALRQHWFTHRDRLLSEWITQHPGTRPWAWWKWDAPEHRRRVDGVIHPFADRKRTAEVERRAAEFPQFREEACKLYYGKPGCLFTTDDFEARYETQPQYLHRLRLLTEQER